MPLLRARFEKRISEIPGGATTKKARGGKNPSGYRMKRYQATLVDSQEKYLEKRQQTGAM